MARAAIFGWGVVAPNCANVDEFVTNLSAGGSWLETFNGFGPDNFLVGRPKFDFATYRPWIEQRFAPARFSQLVEKMDPTTLFAVGAFVQSLGQNPGIENELKALGPEAHVYVGTALGALPTIYDTSITYYRAQRRWNRFWAQPANNSRLRSHLSGESPLGEELPKQPESATDPEDRDELECEWNAFWAARSPELLRHLQELGAIEGLSVQGDVESGKLKLIKEKRRRLAALEEKSGAPEPPWGTVSANVLWNIGNTPACQISMLGKITGPTFAPVAACSTFGVTLKLALDAIERKEAKLVVIGAADPAPHPMTVGAFYSARVLSADGGISKPLGGLRGTHVAGGAAVWIVGDLEYGLSKGFKPLGMEPVSVGVSADAEHIITPSKEGPRHAMREALARAGASPAEVQSWDLHATATPGDFQEVENLGSVVQGSVLITARKGTFGHGMGVCGGWELTAQYLGYERGEIFPTALEESEVHDSIRALKQAFVFNRPVAFPKGVVGKLSMGVGGINACVISRPWK
jgi:3-oxoacyl-[acyl-carrier-protein] synthase II